METVMKKFLISVALVATLTSTASAEDMLYAMADAVVGMGEAPAETTCSIFVVDWTSEEMQAERDSTPEDRSDWGLLASELAKKCPGWTFEF
jgi:hypothetical protein